MKMFLHVILSRYINKNIVIITIFSAHRFNRVYIQKLTDLIVIWIIF
jgi:hypothetical protein